MTSQDSLLRLVGTLRAERDEWRKRAIRSAVRQVSEVAGLRAEIEALKEENINLKNGLCDEIMRLAPITEKGKHDD